MSDLIEKTRLCSVCYKMCRDVCSVAAATRHEADSPHNRGFFAYQIMQGQADLQKEVVDYFYRCSMCKACREACETSLDTSEIMLSARSELDDALLPENLLAKKHAIVSGSIYQGDSDEIRQLLSPYINPENPECLVYFGRRLRSNGADTIRSMIAVLLKLGVDFSALPEEPDTGQLAYFLGFTRDASGLAKNFQETIESSAPQRLVIMSADDLRMIKLEFPRMGLEVKDIEIISLPDFLLEVIKQKKPALSNWNAGQVTYHDPCGLGRELRIFEAPREILRMPAGIELVEMAFCRDQAPCCGYGAGLEITHPEITRKMATRLVSIARDSGAKLLVTGCPTCRSVLLDNLAVTKNNDDNNFPEIIDIPMFVERILP